jgi:hypothetical protein
MDCAKTELLLPLQPWHVQVQHPHLAVAVYEGQERPRRRREFVARRTLDTVGYACMESLGRSDGSVGDGEIVLVGVGVPRRGQLWHRTGGSQARLEARSKQRRALKTRTKLM